MANEHRAPSVVSIDSSYDNVDNDSSNNHLKWQEARKEEEDDEEKDEWKEAGMKRDVGESAEDEEGKEEGESDEVREEEGEDTQDEKTPMMECLKKSVTDRCRCSSTDIRSTMLSFFPVIGHLRSYQWKNWLLNDIVSGLSGGVVHVPQGMGFALLAGVPPVYGLYSSIFPGWLYYLFGTSRHLSVGTMALTALMVGAVVNREFSLLFFLHQDWKEGRGDGNVSTLDYFLSPYDAMSSEDLLRQDGVINGTTPSVMDFTNSSISTEREIDQLIDGGAKELEVKVKIAIALTVTLLAGLCQLTMRVLRLGVLVTYMSMPFVSGFMTGAAIQIMISQLPFMLGLVIVRPSGIFQLPFTIHRVCERLDQSNLCAVVTSFICMIFIIGVKEGINERFKARLRIPVPAEIIVVICATVVSYFAQLRHNFSLNVIGEIATGLPYPVVPPVHLLLQAGEGRWWGYLWDASMIAVVGFVIGITMAKLMSTRHKYQIDANQELLAYGLINTIGPFFGVFAATQAPPRTVVHETTGCKTQMTGFISTVLPLLILLCMGPLFTSLPVAVLGTIIFCALIPLLRQFADLPALWRLNKFDWVTWVITCLSTVVLSVPSGLVIGVATGIFLVVVQGQFSKGYTTLHHHSTISSVPTSSSRHQCSPAATSSEPWPPHEPLHPSSQVFVFRFESSLFFANVDRYRAELYSKTINPAHVLQDASHAVPTLYISPDASADVSHADQRDVVEELVNNNDADAEQPADKSNHETCAELQCEHLKMKTTFSINSDVKNVKRTDNRLSVSENDPDIVQHENNKLGEECTRLEVLVNHGISESVELSATEHNHASPASSRIEQKKATRTVCVIQDCGPISYIDVMGLNAIKQIHSAYNVIGIKFVLANCSLSLLSKLYRFNLTVSDGVRKSSANISTGCADFIEFYSTVQEAVQANMLASS